MAEYVCKVWSADRRTKKSIMTLASTEAVIQTALNFGIKGSKIVLEFDGTEVCGDAILEHYLKHNETLMLIDNEEWCERAQSSTSAAEQFNSVQENSMPPLILSPTQNKEVYLMTLPLDSTDESTITSDAFSSSSETKEPAKLLFLNLKIPWHKVTGDIVNLLNTQQKLGKRLIALANCIVDELRTYSFYIPMGILRSVAQDAIAKYPASLLEKDNEGNIISINTTPLLTSMRNRNNFLNRSPNVKRSELMPNIPLTKRRRSNMLKATCTNWQPLDTIDSLNSLKQKKQYLKNLCDMQSEFQAMDLIKSHMRDCFPLQRKEFNEMDPVPSIDSIRENWPYIFHEECLSQHFLQLTNIKEDLFLKNFNDSKDLTFKFFQTMQNKQTRKAFEKEECAENIIIRSVFNYFNENEFYLFHIFEIGTTLQEVVNSVPTNTPFIAFVKNVLEDSYITYLFIEKIIIFQNTGAITLLPFLKQIIHYFYVFNLIFPTEISQTMEFFVRNFYKYYPPCTRGAKKNRNSAQKVNNLIVKLTNFK